MLTLPDFKEKQIVFVLLQYGEKMRFSNGNLVVHDLDSKIKLQVSCYRLFCIFIVGSLTITDKLLQNARKFGFSIFFLNNSLKVYGSWNSGANGNFILRRKQYRYEGFEIGQFLVKNKISNQLRVLKSIRYKDYEIQNAIKYINEFLRTLNEIEFSDKELLSIEGNVAKLYFKSIFGRYGFKNRRPRVKSDILNLLLDMGYTLLFNLVEAILSIYGFDLYWGVYHKLFFQRKSLVCDMVEPFRCIIDYRIRKAYALNQINEKDFSKINGAYVLFGKESKKYVSFIMQDLLSYKEEIFKFIQNYYRSFMKEESINKYKEFKYKDMEC